MSSPNNNSNPSTPEEPGLLDLTQQNINVNVLPEQLLPTPYQEQQSFENLLEEYIPIHFEVFFQDYDLVNDLLRKIVMKLQEHAFLQKQIKRCVDSRLTNIYKEELNDKYKTLNNLTKELLDSIKSIESDLVSQLWMHEDYGDILMFNDVKTTKELIGTIRTFRSRVHNTNHYEFTSIVRWTKKSLLNRLDRLMKEFNIKHN